MTRTQPNLPNLMAAGGVAILTLLVFVLSRDRGPASSVRRFSQLVLAGNREELARLVESDASAESLASLRQSIGGLMAAEADLRIIRVQAEGRTAAVDAVYASPSLGLNPVRFVLRKPQAVWRIDPDETLDQTRALYRLP